MAEAQNALRLPHVLTQDDLEDVLYSMTDYIGVHEVQFDDNGLVQDAKLLWWNKAYEGIRTKKVETGQSMVERYFEPASALFHVDEAWHTGESQQLFRLFPSMRDRYRVLGARIVNFVRWLRIGDHIVEVGTDIKELVDLHQNVVAQSSLVTQSLRQRDLAVERERIACNLHDFVIQNLYAISLKLAKVGKEAEGSTGAAISESVSGIERVIREIRAEILDLERRLPTMLHSQLTDCLVSILSISGCQLDLRVPDEEVDPCVTTQLVAVCGEAASNAVRHGHASSISIDITRDKGDLVATISDDGTGMDPQAELHNGLNNMRQRATSLGGTMTISERDGGGTVITWTVPHPGWS